jgi:hypothetical protein
MGKLLDPGSLFCIFTEVSTKSRFMILNPEILQSHSLHVYICKLKYAFMITKDVNILVLFFILIIFALLSFMCHCIMRSEITNVLFLFQITKDVRVPVLSKTV